MPLTLPHNMGSFSVSDAKSLLKKTNAFFIRWESSFDSVHETPWWHIIKSDNEHIEELSSNTRSKVRRGLKKYSCYVIERERVISEGYEVYEEAYKRYDTFENRLSREAFKEAIVSLPRQTEFFGVIEKESDKLVAFSENYVDNGACFYLTIWFSPEHLRKYSSYALFHEMNKFYLNERKLNYVSDGARSINHDTNIHDFLISKFGFRKAYAKLNIVYSPFVKLITVLLYPFKNAIKKVPISFSKKLSVLLEQERIRRACIK
ncbi:MAG: GNAT family N-acetyltransferase [Pseudomonadota bacterium]